MFAVNDLLDKESRWSAEPLPSSPNFINLQNAPLELNLEDVEPLETSPSARFVHSAPAADDYSWLPTYVTPPEQGYYPDTGYQQGATLPIGYTGPALDNTEGVVNERYNPLRYDGDHPFHAIYDGIWLPGSSFIISDTSVEPEQGGRVRLPSNQYQRDPARDQGGRVRYPSNQYQRAPERDQGGRVRPPSDQYQRAPERDQGGRVRPPSDQYQRDPARDQGGRVRPPSDQYQRDPARDQSRSIRPHSDQYLADPNFNQSPWQRFIVQRQQTESSIDPGRYFQSRVQDRATIITPGRRDLRERIQLERSNINQERRIEQLAGRRMIQSSQADMRSSRQEGLDARIGQNRRSGAMGQAAGFRENRLNLDSQSTIRQGQLQGGRVIAPMTRGIDAGPGLIRNQGGGSDSRLRPR